MGEPRKVRPDIFFLAQGRPISTPEDVRGIIEKTDVQDFEGVSSLERMGIEKPLTNLTGLFKSLTLCHHES